MIWGWSLKRFGFTFEDLKYSIFFNLHNYPTLSIEITSSSVFHKQAKNADHHSATKEINVLRIKHLICNWWSFSQLSLTLRLTKNIYNFFFRLKIIFHLIFESSFTVWNFKWKTDRKWKKVIKRKRIHSSSLLFLYNGDV